MTENDEKKENKEKELQKISHYCICSLTAQHNNNNNTEKIERKEVANSERDDKKEKTQRRRNMFKFFELYPTQRQDYFFESLHVPSSCSQIGNCAPDRNDDLRSTVLRIYT